MRNISDIIEGYLKAIIEEGQVARLKLSEVKLRRSSNASRRRSITSLKPALQQSVAMRLNQSVEAEAISVFSACRRIRVKN